MDIIQDKSENHEKVRDKGFFDQFKKKWFIIIIMTGIIACFLFLYKFKVL